MKAGQRNYLITSVNYCHLSALHQSPHHRVALTRACRPIRLASCFPLSTLVSVPSGQHVVSVNRDFCIRLPHSLQIQRDQRVPSKKPRVSEGGAPTL